MKDSLRRPLARHLLNYKGWRTERKIVLFESDDWGSIRMPSKQVYDAFLEKGVPVDKSPYCRYDTLASEKDLQALFETLLRFKDQNGRPPVITANTIVANPDFLKIRESNFEEYFYEPFTQTLKRYPGSEKSFLFWQKGIEAGVFHPQFHGREHLNVPLWMRFLQGRHSIYLDAFDKGLWGIDTFTHLEDPVNIMAAFDTLHTREFQFHEKAILEGIIHFENIFGYQPESFIPPNYILDSSHHELLNEHGITTLQGMKMERLPIYTDKKRKVARRYMGEINSFGQTQLVRNCSFEPAIFSTEFDCVGSCLKDIANAFFWNKPAIITSHRLNFIGSLELENRQRNLKQLSDLIKSILKRWPETEFMSSDKLGSEILSENKEQCAE